VTGYGLDGRGVCVRVPEGARFLLHNAQAGSGAHQSPIHWILMSLSPGINRPGCETDHPPLTSVEVKNTYIYIYIYPLTHAPQGVREVHNKLSTETTIYI
jgi:hypothetical protein